MRKHSTWIRSTLLGVPALLVIAMAASVDVAHAGPRAAAARPWAEPARPAASRPPVGMLAPVNDTCAGAILIPCGTFNLSGDTSTATNDYTFPSDAASCTGYMENGPDVVYRLNITAGDSLWMDLSSPSTDAAAYIISDCASPYTSCVAGVDTFDVGGVEPLRYKFTTAGTYYVIIDGFDNIGGAWSATGQLICIVTPPPPANDRCNTPTQLPCGLFAGSGTTEFAANDYSFASAGASCFNSIAAGKDVVYRFTVNGGDSIWVDYTSSSNGCLYIVADCSDPANTCVAGRDATGSGVTEQLRYRFSFGGTYYLILDSQALNSFGTWSMSGQLVCPLPPENDICERAFAIPRGNFSLSGDTKLASDNYSFDTDEASCTGYRAAGRDVVYKIYVSAGDSIVIDYHSTADGSVYIASDCNNVAGSCVAGKDAVGVGETEALRHQFSQAGTYYIFFDSFGAGTYGTWTAVGYLKPLINAVGDPSPGGRLALGVPEPNPFRSTTLIPFALPARSVVRLALIDLQGRVVRTLADGELPAGEHQMRWDGRDDQGRGVRAGVYFVKLVTENGSAMRRAVFVR